MYTYVPYLDIIFARCAVSLIIIGWFCRDLQSISLQHCITKAVKALIDCAGASGSRRSENFEWKYYTDLYMCILTMSLYPHDILSLSHLWVQCLKARNWQSLSGLWHGRKLWRVPPNPGGFRGFHQWLMIFLLSICKYLKMAGKQWKHVFGKMMIKQIISKLSMKKTWGLHGHPVFGQIHRASVPSLGFCPISQRSAHEWHWTASHWKKKAAQQLNNVMWVC